ncbi:FemAB family XrtA/PEP-CTERM system-associated protein [Sphingosinicella sp.]|uniref:FemAB family XrtA/PEP-CTERM system-associated protein n=1 Tax=Sphingosinicella sp. TaxID=1917971 RepID=UPI0040382B0E
MNAPVAITISVRTAELAEAAESARIDDFVRAHDAGTIFHRPQWSRAVERGCGQRAHYLVAERAGALVGCLPLTHVRSRLFGNALVSAGFGTGGGILAEDDRAAARLADAGWALAEALACGSLELRGGPVPAGFDAQGGVYANFDRDLPGDADALLAAVPRRQRTEVRRALESDLETSAGNDATHRTAHFRVYAESVRNLGTPIFPRALFEAMLDEFGDDADIILVRRRDEPLAALLNFYFNGTCQPFWGGGTFAARSCKANDLIYFDVMRRAVARGCTRADFGRSKVGTGPWSRKRIWGFDETPLVYAVRSASGAARAINPLDARYRLKVEAWKRLPLWAANRLGPLIARGLG